MRDCPNVKCFGCDCKRHLVKDRPESERKRRGSSQACQSVTVVVEDSDEERGSS